MQQISKPDLIAILERAGFADVVASIEPVLPDPIDIDRDEPLLASYGITRGAIMDHLGSSP